MRLFLALIVFIFSCVYCYAGMDIPSVGPSDISISDATTGSPLRIDNGTASVGNLMLEIAMGNKPGYSHINKFGHNAAATTGDDIWTGGGVYTFYPSSAIAVDIVSTSTADNGATATGAIQIIVYGLTTGFVEATETITLNGQTPVQMDTVFRRIYRAQVLEAGSGNTNAGSISIYERGDATNEGAVISIADGQTQQCNYTVPDGKTAYFIKGYTALRNSTFQGEVGSFNWLLKLNNGVNGAWLVQGEIGLINIGTSYWQYEYGVPAGPLPEWTDIRINQNDASATMDSVCGYDLILVEDGY